MEQLRVSILSVGALLSVVGLILLGFGWPHGRLSRRIIRLGVPFLPVATYTVWLASYARPPAGHGGFLSPWTLGLMMLSPLLLIWLLACFFAWAFGKVLRES
jgi:hypothetical protein